MTIEKQLPSVFAALQIIHTVPGIGTPQYLKLSIENYEISRPDAEAAIAEVVEHGMATFKFKEGYTLTPFGVESLNAETTKPEDKAPAVATEAQAMALKILLFDSVHTTNDIESEALEWYSSRLNAQTFAAQAETVYGKVSQWSGRVLSKSIEWGYVIHEMGKNPETASLNVTKKGVEALNRYYPDGLSFQEFKQDETKTEQPEGAEIHGLDHMVQSKYEMMAMQLNLAAGYLADKPDCSRFASVLTVASGMCLELDRIKKDEQS